MKKSVKALLLVMCAIVLVVATVFTTLAFLKDATGEIKNTFSVGAVGISLKETKVDAYGNPVDSDPETDGVQKVILDADDEGLQENSYKIVPGETYTKDPYVTVNAGSEASYVFVAVKGSVPNNLLSTTENIGGLVVNTTGDASTNPWTEYSAAGLVGYTVYYQEVGNVESEKVLKVFGSDEFTVAENAALAEEFALEFKAFAIQKEGFNTVDLAWQQLLEEYPQA